MDQETRRKYALMALGATGACIGAIILLVRSALGNKGEPDSTTIAISVALLAIAAVVAFYVRLKRSEAIEREKNPPREPVDEEREALLDYFYDMEREKEFYSCLESGSPIDYVDDYEDGVAGFEKVKSEAVAAGSTAYIWRTSRDNTVCLRCRRLNGKRYAWNNPPLGGHPGCAPGCRCRAEPVMPSTRQAPKTHGKMK